MNFEEIPLPDHIAPYAPLISNLIYGVIILAAGWMVSKWTNRLVHTLSLIHI